MFNTYDTSMNGFRKIYDRDELSAMVYNTIDYYARRNKILEDRCTQLEENAKQVLDERLKKENEDLREQLSMSYGEFSSQVEKDRYLKFQDRHIHDRATSRANGGKCPYLIPTGTGIGVILKVVCPICGEMEDITDTEVW